MRARFLLGPAGSGKTWRCLAEIRTALRLDPAGPPLLLLAPKQATFQLERQLLSDPELPGFARLRVLSLDRLAADVIADTPADRPVLGEDGRVMVLRALLARHATRLELFHATARLPGFARHLSLSLRELQLHRQSPRQLRQHAARPDADPGLARKLRDCALLLEAYLDWLQEHRLQDADALLDEAARVIAAAPGSCLRPAALWLDGFAEMTPQEIELLATLIPRCDQATLAFCLPPAAAGQESTGSPWAVVGRACAQLETRLRQTPGVDVHRETLPSSPERTRFAHNPTLQALEQGWRAPLAPSRAPGSAGQTSLDPATAALALVCCPNPEAEAVCAAREILAHVRGGGRFRETAVLVRSLDGYHAAVRRVFRRYDIPFFLDRRESVSHHPAAELTRYAVRLIALDWRQEDWFGALKTGLCGLESDHVDALENAALERGWDGPAWQHPLQPDSDPLVRALEPIRARAVQAFLVFAESVCPPAATGLTGAELATALRRLWQSLCLPEQLEAWAEAATLAPGSAQDRPGAVHRTVWEQLQLWADNLELAFETEPLRLRDWLPVLESGLAGLSVGVVPPALDQVLIGAIDRSRNPDLERVLVLGVNDNVFPQVPDSPGLFSDADRHQLELLGVRLGPDRRALLAHERYYAYIAFTRARSRLVVAWSERDGSDQPRNPSPFVDHLRALCPEVEVQRFEPSLDWHQAQHPAEVAAAFVASRRPRQADTAPAAVPEDLLPDDGSRDRLQRLALWEARAVLSPAVAARLYGPVLRTSISALERFAACPFRFFVLTGLRADERPEFVVDTRERGSFQHEVLARFHRSVTDEGRRWRDLAPEDAAARVGTIAAAVAAEYRGGLFHASPEARFAARGLVRALQRFLAVTIRWMRSYQFDPVAVELGFGGTEDPLPAWRIDLGDQRWLELRGRIDRVDLAANADPTSAWVTVIDYKSSSKTLETIQLEHGLQAQLPAYLGVLCQSPERLSASANRSFARVEPAGAFYVSLRPARPSRPNRAVALQSAPDDEALAFKHRGRFRSDLLPVFDPGTEPSGQFHYQRLKDGGFHKRSTDPMSPEAFAAMLGRTEDRLRDAGRRILDGDIRIDPYRLSSVVACDQCELQAVCRVNRWTHRFRALTTATATATAAEAEADPGDTAP